MASNESGRTFPLRRTIFARLTGNDIKPSRRLLYIHKARICAICRLGNSFLHRKKEKMLSVENEKNVCRGYISRPYARILTPGVCL